MLPLEYWMQFQLAIFSENPQPGEGTVKRCPGKLYELEEFQESRGWESLWFLFINTLGRHGGKWQTIQPEGQSDTKHLSTNWPSADSSEIWGKFLVIQGMKKQVSLIGRRQHKNVTDPQHEAQLDPEAAVPHGCLKWPRATRPRGWRAPLPPPCPAPVLRAATKGVPARWGVPGLRSYTSRCLTGCTDDEADLWTAVSQPSRKVAPFSHNAVQNTTLSSVSPAAPGIA